MMGAPASDYVPVDSDEALPVVSVHSTPKLSAFASDADRSDIGETYGLLNVGDPMTVRP
jgi:proteasome lid subunit RPN8/RPN11